MSFYPILTNLSGKKAVVVGGGDVAQRKVDSLLECNAAVHLIARDITPTLHAYIKKGEIQFLGPDFKKKSLNGAFLVIAATDDPALNHMISEFAQKKRILVNAVDQPEDCSFIVPSTIRRGDLVIAVSTSGKSPALAKKIRERISVQFGDEYKPFLSFMGYLRKIVLNQGHSQEAKSRLFHTLVDSPILEAIADEDWEKVRSILDMILGIKLSHEDIINFIKGG
jgi:precorrin-2 dehydrogenase/sirohydrochlorin ferrochelatase